VLLLYGGCGVVQGRDCAASTEVHGEMRLKCELGGCTMVASFADKDIIYLLVLILLIEISFILFSFIIIIIIRYSVL